MVDDKDRKGGNKGKRSKTMEQRYLFSRGLRQDCLKKGYYFLKGVRTLDKMQSGVVKFKSIC